MKKKVKYTFWLILIISRKNNITLKNKNNIHFETNIFFFKYGNYYETELGSIPLSLVSNIWKNEIKMVDVFDIKLFYLLKK